MRDSGSGFGIDLIDLAPVRENLGFQILVRTWAQHRNSQCVCRYI